MKQLQGGTRTSGTLPRRNLPDKPLVSIITVCLNSEKYLEQTIQSVINQTYDNIEYIIIDGGSADKTLDIIRKYEEDITYWISEPDKGIYDAMNKGISFAGGEWVGIINSDDWYAEDAVALVVEATRSDQKAQLFYGDQETLACRESENPRNCRKCKGLANKYMPHHPTCFVSKKIYEKLKYNITLKITADWDFMFRLYLDNIRFGYINKPLVYFRPGGISGSLSAQREIYQVKNFHETLLLPFITRSAAEKSIETGRLPLSLLFRLCLFNIPKILSILCKILRLAVKISLAKINTKLTRQSVDKYRGKYNNLLFKLRYGFPYRYRK